MKFRTSHFKFIFNYFFAIFILLLIVIVKKLEFQTYNLEYVLLIILLFLLLQPEGEIYLTYYMINENEVKKVSGIFRKSIVSINIKNVSHVEVKQGIFDRVLNIGDIIVATQTSKLTLKGVKDPMKIFKIIKERAA